MRPFGRLQVLRRANDIQRRLLRDNPPVDQRLEIHKM
jgi:hypothetical protein